MVRHLGDYSWEPKELADFGELLDRDQVIGTPLADRTFAVVDDIWLSDPYVQNFVAFAQEESSDVEQRCEVGSAPGREV